MIFPRRTVKIGKCRAMISRHYTHVGEAYTDQRYPFLMVAGEQWQAHRLSFTLNNKKIPRRPCPEGKGIWRHKMVLHKCGHKWCIEPKHLYLGNHKRNSSDWWRRDITPAQMEKFKCKMRKVCANPEYRRKMSISLSKRRLTDEHKRKIAIATAKRTCSEATRRKMSRSAKLRCARVPKAAMLKKMRAVNAAKYGG